jgi:pimeloyl-ACP methyl ester carboxylesterase
MGKQFVVASFAVLAALGFASFSARADGVTCTPSGRDPAKIGIVLMHGKATFSSGGGNMGYLGGGMTDFLAELKDTIRRAGYKLVAPAMPWTQYQQYSVDYMAAMDMIAADVAELRSQGAERIVVGGHSLGGNAAIGYGGIKGDVDGIIALAPAHNPELSFARNLDQDSVAKAQAMVAAGKGDEKADFQDFNSGNRRGTVTTTAKNYLSFFDPAGPAVMPVNVVKFKPSEALLWIVADGDPTSHLGPGYAFDKAPPNPLNRFVTVSSDHLHTPSAAIPAVMAWLKCI